MNSAPRDNMTIYIKKSFKEDYVTREAGEKLRKLIIESENNYNQIEIDFENLIIASVSFFDEAFAKLLENQWTKKQIDSKIVLKNISARDLEVYNKMLKVRLKI